ncbi:MAG: tyrosine-protein phosphatase [Sphingobium sp.]
MTDLLAPDKPLSNPRLVPLTGGFNLRDFGGYATQDGRRVKRGRLYRSGTMALLTGEDADRLRALRIGTIIDLRRQDERLAEPTRWHEAGGTGYWCRDYGEGSGVLTDIMRQDDATRESMFDGMMAVYRAIPADHAPSYARMFATLAETDRPILINCAAGKDRTGFAAALLLSALGVPRATIEQDYLATNDHADWDWLFSHRTTLMARNVRSRPEMMAPLLRADPVYLAAGFDAVERDHGGMAAYLASLGADAATIARLRETLLEP